MSEQIYCYVYIIGNKNNSYSIKYTLDIDRDIPSLPSDCKLLYYREFYNITDGIAYKLFLDSISTGSIESIISKQNSSFRDLSKDYQSKKQLLKTNL